jgi:glycerophosphoryl diester phosphodiesterase
MLNHWPRPMIFAHRGASAYAPENTLAAFELAYKQGAQGIELDAKLSADGQVVVIHDARLERTTDGHGRVARQRLSALRELDAGSFFSEKFRGERIPTLGEVFEALGEKLYINVELTNYSTPGDDLVPHVAKLVVQHGLQQRVIFSSFSPLNLSKMVRLLPEVPRGLLAFGGWMGWWARSFGFAFGSYAALHPHLNDVTSAQVQRVHRLKRRIHVWTVNLAEDMRHLRDWGVDAIITDDPALAVQTFGMTT